MSDLHKTIEYYKKIRGTYRHNGFEDVIFMLIEEIDRLQDDLDNERAKGIHTCHSKCQRPLCVANRRIEELRAEVAQLNRNGITWREYYATEKAENEKLRAVVDAQAEDEGLWFQAETAPEAYLQRELRRLHAYIENDQKALAVLKEQTNEQND